MEVKEGFMEELTSALRPHAGVRQMVRGRRRKKQFQAKRTARAVKLRDRAAHRCPQTDGGGSGSQGSNGGARRRHACLWDGKESEVHSAFGRHITCPDGHARKMVLELTEESELLGPEEGREQSGKRQGRGA